MTHQDPDTTRTQVREHYAEVARSDGACGCGPGCCAPGAGEASLRLGYTPQELGAVPDGADLGLGCGTPLSFAALAPGETALDLGSGGGLDCLLAARQVGERGRIIGVDMTPEMIAKARANADKVGATNVEFRLGEIERLPLPDRSVDVIVSNCVINLSPDKPAVFREALRVLRPGGRIAISDLVASSPLPDAIKNDPSAFAGCMSGAPGIDELRSMLAQAGFTEIEIAVDPKSRSFIRDWLPGSGVETFISSARIRAQRPSGDGCCATAPSSGCC